MNQVLPKYRWAVLAVVCLICFISNFIQFQVSSLGYIIVPQMGLTTAQFTSIMMAPFLTGVFLSIPSGMLGDRVGAKKVVAIGCVVSVLGAFGRLVATSYVPMLVTVFAVGVAISLVNANLIKILGIWFQQDTGKAMGIFYASSCAGIVLAQMSGPLFPTVNSAYMFSSVVMLVAAVLWIAVDKDCPAGMSLPEPEPTLEYMKVAVKSKNTWIVAIATGLGMGTTTAYAGILPQALSIGKGVDEIVAGNMAAIVTVGSFLASLIGPAVCSKFGKFKPFLIITTLIGAILMYITWHTPIGFMMWVILVLNGFFSALQGPMIQSMPIMFPEIGEKYAGSAGGIVGTVSLLVSYVIPIVIAQIAGESFALNLALEGVVFAISAICIIILPETGPKGKLAKERAQAEQ